MRSSIPLFFLSAVSVFAQAPTLANATATSTPVAPDTVVATINGKPYTAADVDQIVKNFPKTQQQNFQRSPKQFLEEWAQMQSILAEAEKEKLGQQSPYKDQLEDLERTNQLYRKQILYNAELTERANRIPVTTEAMQARYNANKDKYREAKVKMIYIPYTAANEAETRAKAASVVKQAREGADFVKLVKEHSEDPGSAAKGGDLGVPVRNTTEKIPADMRTAILAAKPGDVTEPLKGNNAFYVFRVESIETVPFEQVKNEIYKEIQNAGLIEWIKEMRSKTTVNIENNAYFQR